MSWNAACQLENGLVKPDLVIQLDCPVTELERRFEFGHQPHGDSASQERIQGLYTRFAASPELSPYWEVRLCEVLLSRIFCSSLFYFLIF